MKTFFIGDTHFGGFPNGLNTDNRPDIATMVKLWNSIVSEDDIVYHLGDVINSNYNLIDTRYIIEKLNGNKYLIMGNHDRHFTIDQWHAVGFSKVYDHPIIVKGFVILCHEPLFITSKMPYLMAFAHVHDNPIYKTECDQARCFSADRTEWMPACWDKYDVL